MSVVLDASAMLALLRGEPGGDYVQELLDDADVPIHAHSVNLLEVFYFVARHSDVLQARQTLADLRAAGVVERSDLDTAFLEDAATLKADWNCALGDCFGLALARRIGADFATADHHELDPVDTAGVCGFIFIR